MHFHLPKPLHGWREFVGEVGIIVIGVDCVGAEQVVETLHWNHVAAGARESVSGELDNLFFDASEMAIAQPVSIASYSSSRAQSCVGDLSPSPVL